MSEKKEDSPKSLANVLVAELKHIGWHRYQVPPESKPCHGERFHFEKNLVGLALSGGGIRAATTHLGVLQALSKMRLLECVDYLCTVSGGGYIGGCLTSLLSLNELALKDLYCHGDDSPSQPDQDDATGPYQFQGGMNPRFSTEQARFPFRAESYTRDGKKDADGHLGTELIKHLRTHGSFLIARRGLMKRDTMRAVGNLLTGIAFNILGFLLLMCIAASLVVVVAEWRLSSLDSAFSRASESGSSVHVGNELLRNLSRVVLPLLDSDAWHNAIALAVMLGATYVIVLGVLQWLSVSGHRSPRRPKPGESAEEVSDRFVLQMAAYLGLGLLTALWFFKVRSPLGAVPKDSPAWLLIPLAVMAGARAMTFLIALVAPHSRRWRRHTRSIWGGTQAVMIYGMWITFGFALLPPVIATFAHSHDEFAVAVSGLSSLAAARLLLVRRAASNLRRLPESLWKAGLGIAVLLVVALGVVFFGALVLSVGDSYQWLAGSIIASIVLGYFVNHNKLSPHYFYRDRISEAYLLTEIERAHRMTVLRDAMEMPLTALHGCSRPATDQSGNGDKIRAYYEGWRNPAPYHLISAAINLGGSRDLTRKDRKSGYWLFSKLFCGSVHTGFRATDKYRDGETKLARALTISGAAASSAMGAHTFFAQAFATVVFNVRLGHWLENPSNAARTKRNEGLVFWPWYLMKEVLMSTSETDTLVNLSDGGHTGDNVGIYPLLQRRCKVIIASDAEADTHLAFGSFTEALRHAYIDEGINVDIDLSMIRPDPTTGRSRSHCAVGRIRYPDRPDQVSYLIYMKNSLTGDEPEPILNYHVSFDRFPHESTADQFFSDAQFESYRALGAHLAETTFSRWTRSEGANLRAWHAAKSAQATGTKGAGHRPSECQSQK